MTATTPAAMTPAAIDVFLSYSSRDRAAARCVQAALEARGLDVFWDQETPPGADWDAWIRARLAAARLVIVLWSRSSVASPNVRHEAIIARDDQKLLPVAIDRLSAADFPMGLYLVQAVSVLDWKDAKSAGMTELLDRVDERLGRASPRRRPMLPGRPSWPLFAAVAGAIGVIALWLATDRTQREAPQLSVVLAEPQPNPATEAPTAAPAEASPPEASPPPPLRVVAAPPPLTRRLAGRWRSPAATSCRDGPRITVSSDHRRVIFMTPGSRYTHLIEAWDAAAVRTRVIEPEFALGEQYVLSLQSSSGRSKRGYDLILENATAGTRERWTPCESQP